MLSAELFKRGEAMTASLTASEAQTWLADAQLSQMLRPSRAAFNFSYWYAFNYYIKGADGSWVLTENGVEEMGTHEELLKKGGLYAHLYAMYTEREKA